MGIFINGDTLKFTYYCDSDVQNIKKFVDEDVFEFTHYSDNGFRAEIKFVSISDLQSDFCYVRHSKVYILISEINDSLCDNIKCLIERIPKIKAVKLMCKCHGYGYVCNRNFNYDSIIKLLQIFSGVKILRLDAIYDSDKDDTTMTLMIKHILRNASTKKLILRTQFISVNDIIKIISDNDKIKCVDMRKDLIDLAELINFNIIIPKIDTLRIFELGVCITKDMMIKIFQLVPNLRSLIFYGNAYDNIYTTVIISDDTLEEIMNFVTRREQFDTLNFSFCGLSHENIEHICNKLVGYNIRSVTLNNFCKNNGNSNHRSIANMITNTKSLEKMKLALNSISELLNIIESLNDASVTFFTVMVNEENDSNFYESHSKISDALSQNFSLTHICININYSSQFYNHIMDTKMITDRNIKLSKERRFTNTKVAALIN